MMAHTHPYCLKGFALWIMVLIGAESSGLAQEKSLAVETDTDDRKGLPNMKLPTLGGKQFWTDHIWRDGWKIQQNAVTGHWRLIDAKHLRHAWGSKEACMQALQQAKPDLQPAPQRIFVLVHGLIRSSSSMKPLGKALEEAYASPVVRFEYASTRDSITAHTTAFREMIASLPRSSKLAFVGHSMGSIIIRHAIGDWKQSGDTETLNRLEHVVMLGPPNQGASIARQLSRLELFGWVFGKGGLELGPHWKEFEAKLAVPDCPFGIIAGRTESVPENPLVDGQGDFVVSVDETKLEGARDFLEVAQLHSFLMDDPVVQQATVNFMRHAAFH